MTGLESAVFEVASLLDELGYAYMLSGRAKSS
jgi:hypothetical protein